MRAILLTVLVLGCHRDELGSTPRLVGKLANISVHDTQDQVEAIDSHLTDGREIDDGGMTYRIDWDHAHRIRAATVWVKGSIDEVMRAWGDGVVGRDAHFYFDALASTRYEVTAADDRVVVKAMPYRPLDEILDANSDVKVFGIDLFALPPDAVMPALEDKLLPMNRFAGQTTIIHTDTKIATDVGDVGLTVEAQQDVVAYSLDFEAGAFLDGRERIRALLERKWGAPRRDRVADFYSTTFASRIRVREHDEFIDVEVDR
jgi:hypothetical protein